MSILKRILFALTLGLLFNGSKELLAFASQEDSSNTKCPNTSIAPIEDLSIEEQLRALKALKKVNSQFKGVGLDNFVFTIENGKVKIIGIKTEQQPDALGRDGNPTSH